MGAEPVLSTGIKASGSRGRWERLERQRPLGLGEALGLRLEAGRPEEAPLP